MGGSRRIIDVEKEALLVVAEALARWVIPTQSLPLRARAHRGYQSR
jgi:hypothetical protein